MFTPIRSDLPRQIPSRRGQGLATTTLQLGPHLLPAASGLCDGPLSSRFPPPHIDSPRLVNVSPYRSDKPCLFVATPTPIDTAAQDRDGPCQLGSDPSCPARLSRPHLSDVPSQPFGFPRPALPSPNDCSCHVRPAPRSSRLPDVPGPAFSRPARPTSLTLSRLAPPSPDDIPCHSSSRRAVPLRPPTPSVCHRACNMRHQLS